MTNVPYNTNIPFASNTPSQDQPRMQENTNSLKSLIEFDHVGFGNNQGGYHTVIHEATQTSVNTIAGVNQIFSGVPGTLLINAVATPAIPNNGDTQLYSLTGAGGRSQLTGNSTAGTNGFQWLGGALLQWGIINAPASGDNAVVFPATFPTNILNIQVSVVRAAANIDAIVIKTGSISTAGFIAIAPTAGSTSIYWMAIGS